MLISYNFTEEQFKKYFMVLFKQQITLSGVDSITYEDMDATVFNDNTEITWDSITVSCEVPEYVSDESEETEEPNEGNEGNENEGSGEEEENNNEGGGE